MFRCCIALLLLTTVRQMVMGQGSSADSLEKLLRRHSQDDTTRVNILNELSYQYRWIDFVNSQRYAEQALRIAQALHYDKGIATANYRIGHCYWALGDNELAIEKGLDAAAVAERLDIAAQAGTAARFQNRRNRPAGPQHP